MTITEPARPAVDTAERTPLRVATCGSVDDGKSTLIGRLLHDTGAVLDDQLAAVARASARRGDHRTDLALLTDGLRAEREQGITIDVAWRYFSTPARSFILVDTPGHAQYTRNTVTGLSAADVAVVLVDARHGASPQTRRHVAVAGLLALDHLVVAVNKMDLVGWSEEVFRVVAKDLADHASRLERPLPVTCVPVSALHGDNVVDRSPAAGWYGGPALLELLEALEPGAGAVEVGARLPVQWVIRTGSERAYAGQLAGGPLHPGDRVVVLPAGTETTVTAVELGGAPLARAVPGQAVAVRLADAVDAGRGDTIAVTAGRPPAPTATFDADVCWMGDRPLGPTSRWLVKHGTRTTRAIAESVLHRLDVDALTPEAGAALERNDLGRVRFRTADPLVADPYELSPATGRFVVIDEVDNATAGAGLLRGVR